MQPVKHNILNGINLYYIEDKKYKTVSASVFISRKVKKDEVTKTALLSNVLKRGTNNLKNMKEINRHLENLYGAVYDIGVFKNGDIHTLMLEISYLSKQYADENIETNCTDLIIDFLFNPRCENGAFVKSYVDSEKVNLKDEIESIINDKKAYADHRCKEEMFKGKSEGIRALGNVADLDEINEVNLYEHYKNIIFSSPINIFIVGDADVEKIVSRFKEKLSSFEFNAKDVKSETVITPAGEVKYITDKMNVNQGKLAIGLKTEVDAKSPLYYPLVVGNSIFGSGAHSKLFNNVREKLSLCYYAASRIDKFTGSMLVSSGIEFKNFEKAKNEIFVQLDAVKNGDFTEEELDIAKEYLINANTAALDNPFSLKVYHYENLLLDKSTSIDEANEKISKVTKEDIISAFKNINADVVYFLSGNN